MVQVRIISRELNSERTAYIDVVRAELRVHGHEVEVAGDRSWVDFDVPVLDPETGRSLRYEDDPEAWARRLPDAYRSGDLVVMVDEAGVAVGATAYARQG